MANAFSQLDTSFPSMDGKNTEAKIQAIQDYLYQLLEQLRYTLNNLNPDNFNEAEVNGWAGETITKPIHAEIVDTANGLITYIDATAAGVTVNVQKEYAAEWTSGTRYYLNDFAKVTTVNSDQTETVAFYKCIDTAAEGHAASADNKPGDGQHWEDYWVVVDAEAVAYSRFDINADMIRSEVGRAERSEQSIITQTSNNINAAVSGIYASEWESGATYYETNIVKITTVNDGVTTTDYYKCKEQHVSAAVNKPPNTTYWDSVPAPNVQSVLDIGLNGITIAYDNTQTGGEANASYIKLHKDGIDMGGGLIKVTDLDASTIKTGILDANNIILRDSFSVQAKDNNDVYQPVGKIGGAYKQTDDQTTQTTISFSSPDDEQSIYVTNNRVKLNSQETYQEPNGEHSKNTYVDVRKNDVRIRSRYERHDPGYKITEADVEIGNNGDTTIFGFGYDSNNNLDQVNASFGPDGIELQHGIVGDLVTIRIKDTDIVAEKKVSGTVTVTNNLLQPCLPLYRFTDMTANTVAALLSSLNANNSQIPTGPSVVACGNSLNSNRCMVMLFKAGSTVGRGVTISPYTAVNNINVYLNSSGDWAQATS